MEEALWKRIWETPFFYHQFKRTPTKGWLKEGETISSVDSVKVYDDDGNEIINAIIGTPAVSANTKVVYRLSKGIPIGLYEVRIRIVASSGEEFEDHIPLEIIGT